jgi:hypothetical protein
MAPAASRQTDAAAPQFSQIVSQTVAAGATVDLPITVPQAQASGVTLLQC